MGKEPGPPRRIFIQLSAASCYLGDIWEQMGCARKQALAFSLEELPTGKTFALEAWAKHMSLGRIGHL